MFSVAGKEFKDQHLKANCGTTMDDSLKKPTTDWTKCCLCQLDTNEELRCPQNNPVKRNDGGYMNLARNIPKFQSLNQLPIGMDPSRLDEGVGINETLTKNKASYHRNCQVLFSNGMLQRAEKRSTPSGTIQDDSRKKIPRISKEIGKYQCFLCESTIGELREAMTMKLNDRVKGCAKTLNDGNLLAKLSGGDVVAQELKYHPACLVALYNKERDYLRVQEQESAQEHWKEVYPIAFSELVTHICEKKVQ